METKKTLNATIDIQGLGWDRGHDFILHMLYKIICARMILCFSA